MARYSKSEVKKMVESAKEIASKCKGVQIVYDVYSNSVFGLYARWRFKAITFNLALMMIEAQMFNLPLHRHWRKTRVMLSLRSFQHYLPIEALKHFYSFCGRVENFFK